MGSLTLTHRTPSKTYACVLPQRLCLLIWREVPGTGHGRFARLCSICQQRKLDSGKDLQRSLGLGEDVMIHWVDARVVMQEHD